MSVCGIAHSCPLILVMTFVQSDHRSCNDYFSKIRKDEIDLKILFNAIDVLRDIEDASRMLRLARAERDAAL